MKRSLVGVLVLVLLALSLGAPAARAQAQSKQAFAIVADVPWEFMIENKTLPAGKYEFRQTPDNPSEWTVADAKGKVMLVFATEPAQMANPPKKYEAVFNVVGTNHFLVGLWLESGEGFSVPMTESQKAMMKEGTKERIAAVKK